MPCKTLGGMSLMPDLPALSRRLQHTMMMMPAGTGTRQRCLVLRATPLLLPVLLCAVLMGCGKGKDHDATQVVAKVNDKEISVHQLNFLLERQPGLKPEQADAASRQLLERLVDQEIGVQRAEALKLDREPRVMQTLEATRRDVLARAYFEQVGSNVSKPTDSEIQAYFDGKPNLFAQRKIYNLQEIDVRADGEQLAAIKARAATATNLQEMAQLIQSMKVPAQVKQNTLPAESVPMALLGKLAGMRPGQAMLLPAPGGTRILVLAAFQPQPVTLEQAKPLIERAIMNERRNKAMEEDRKAQRSAAKIEFIGKFAKAAPAAASAPADVPSVADAAASAASGIDNSALEKGLNALK